MDGWTPGIGDPTILGWVTVVGYMVAAALCLRSAMLSDRAEDLRGRASEQRRFWSVSAMVLLGLGINKQLDLQTLVTDIGRTLARQEGWYDVRRTAQGAFIAFTGIGTIVLVGALVHRLRHQGRYVAIAVAGEALLAAFVLVRAASFQHVDVLMLATIGSIRAVHLIELGAIAIVTGAAVGAGRAEAIAERTALAVGAISSEDRKSPPPALITTDPMEQIIEAALLTAGIRYETDQGGTNLSRLDFRLPDFDVEIEVKRMHSDRISEQMSRAENVVVAQGEAGVRFLAAAIAAMPSGAKAHPPASD